MTDEQTEQHLQAERPRDWKAALKRCTTCNSTGDCPLCGGTGDDAHGDDCDKCKGWKCCPACKGHGTLRRADPPKK